MNIALLPSAFHPSLGGVEELVRQLAHELADRGHGVELYTNRWPKTLAEDESFETLRVNRYCFRVPERTTKQLVGATLLGPRTLRALTAALRRQSAQVLHVQCVSSNAYYAIQAKRRLGLPLVVTLQGELTMDANRLFERSAFARRLLRQTLDSADVITACSTKTRDDAEKFYGRGFGLRGKVIWNGASEADFSQARPYLHRRPYILALGRLVPQKGFDVLIRAMAAAGENGHDLLIAGDGPERVALEALSTQLGVSDRVQFLGRADRKGVGSLFVGCAFFVLSSRSDEGLPVVCAEALAAGKAIIATRAGGAPEAIAGGKAGILVPKEDIAALAIAIVSLCHDIQLRHKLELASRRQAEQFSWRKIADEYVNAYRQATESLKQRRGLQTV